jgi:stage V sporulation protein R
MELISQHAKKIMEGCKERARDAGLRFQDESLEYVVSNRDMLELSPKNMIPTMYDYWVQDVEVLKGKGRYELYPSNPYETVINTRPPISFYNDNNPDWLNVMIFYHVLGHIDFFQNNLFFRHTWDYDFTGRALSDKRLIARLRSEKGRYVDYVLEFARSIDNLVGYFDHMADFNRVQESKTISKMDYYFDVFLQSKERDSVNEYIKELERYNECLKKDEQQGEDAFFEGVSQKYGEFGSYYTKFKEDRGEDKVDLLRFLMDHSEFLNREENRWMLSVVEVVRSTSLYFQPQIRTKICNEGWASYWHERLFLNDDRIVGHEVDFSRINAYVTSMPRVGLNPYALGMRLFSFLKEMGDKGCFSMDYRMLQDAGLRGKFDRKKETGKDFIFSVRENYCDSLFVNSFIDQDFVDRYKLFVAGKRLNKERMTWQYYVRSRSAESYKQMVLGSLYHPPSMEIGVTKENTLILKHRFEKKPLVRDYIGNTMLGIEYLWGGPVWLETSELIKKKNVPSAASSSTRPEKPKQLSEWKRFRYIMKNRKLSRLVL